ncbi:aldo/keto reductase [Herbidospora sp. NEAU-GS84]|uniref:Aldo/keto reductase n=2 Tax=Herbidospora solisilvae TaxID=2696284 RepID=A0A7C9K0C8_9ACTN|nr:aldo/keto reductase [Herbidospora solisilvae]
MSQDGTTRTLADGGSLPLVGLGVWQVPDGRACVDAVRWALDAGYRHIDTAQAYGNETSVGKALRESGLDRAEVFITTKFHPGGSDPVRAAEQSLRRLGTDYVDLYLVHWPQGGPTRAWPGMERAAELGYTRSIGVSNFDVAELAEVTAIADRPPTVNQVSFSPVTFRRELWEACERAGVVLEAYSPLGTGRLLGDQTVKAIADETGWTPAQVLLRWAVQKRIPVIPKSVHRERIEQNLRIFDIELSDEAMARLDALDRTHGTAKAQERKWW